MRFFFGILFPEPALRLAISSARRTSFLVRARDTPNFSATSSTVGKGVVM